jgi:hypothetical protein
MSESSSEGQSQGQSESELPDPTMDGPTEPAPDEQSDTDETAEDSDDTDDESSNESQDVPDGTVQDVKDWVGDDPDRAQAALAAENEKDEPRVTLVDWLEKHGGDSEDDAS